MTRCANREYIETMPSVECPECHLPTASTLGKTYCPQCGWNREAAEKQTRLLMRLLPVLVILFDAPLIVYIFPGDTPEFHPGDFGGACNCSGDFFVSRSTRESASQRTDGADRRGSDVAGRNDPDHRAERRSRGAIRCARRAYRGRGSSG